MSLTILPARTKREVRRFVDVPWQLDFKRYPGWVPPLRVAVHDVLDTRHHPFYETAEIALWTAHRGKRLVGRIAAIENRAHHDSHGDGVGFFGFFECEDEQETADALFSVSAHWLRERGLTVMRGPVSPSMNHECGLLVENFEEPTKVMTPWNPEYYDSLLRHGGFEGIKDMLSFWMSETPTANPLSEHARLLERLRSRGHVTCRAFDFNRFDEELETMRRLYNEAWADSWGFVPLSEREFGHMSKSLRFIANKELILVAEVKGQPAAFLLVLPDLNQVFRTIPSGRLSPWALWKILRARHTLPEVRVVLLGVGGGFRNLGLFSVLVQNLLDRGRALGKTGCEASWVFEDNEVMKKLLDKLGPRTRRWRMYQKDLVV